MTDRDVLNKVLSHTQEIESRWQDIAKHANDADATEQAAMDVLARTEGSATFAVIVLLTAWFAEGLVPFKLWNNPDTDSWYVQFGPDVYGPAQFGDALAWLFGELGTAVNAYIKETERRLENESV